jgi:hypothetical protein
MKKVYVILGPVPCQGCRKPVVYGMATFGEQRTLRRWRDPVTAHVHVCGAIG